MPEAREDFLESIDQSVDADQSVVLRYRNAVRFDDDDEKNERFRSSLIETSLREGLRIVPLMQHQGVSIEVLDESSWMASGTLKSIDGCIAAARSLTDGFGRCVFESGGNTGSALTKYGATVDLETFFLVPTENVNLLDSSIFERESAHLIAIDDPGEVKSAAARLAELEDLRRIPEAGWRFQASTLIGCFLAEHLTSNPGYDYIVQSISAAFGPIGIFKVLGAHRGEDAPLPRFVGIQQAANCPMFRAWRGENRRSAEPIRSTSKLLTRVMYDSEPHTYGTFQQLHRLLNETGGYLDTIDHEEFFDGLESRAEGRLLIDHLESSGIRIGLREGEVIEKAGLIALIGAIKQIDRGLISSGSRVLVCLTGGTAQPDGLAVPDHRISDASEIDSIVGRTLTEAQRSHG